MKIAVPLRDGASVSRHFGRSRCFLVFEVEKKKAVASYVAGNVQSVGGFYQCHE